MEEKLEDILSKQNCFFEFKDGKVKYFSLSSQHGVADTIQEAIDEILKADEEWERKSPFEYFISKSKYQRREYDVKTSNTL